MLNTEQQPYLKGWCDDSDDSKTHRVGIGWFDSSAGHILFVANWLAEKGVVDWARDIRSEYLTGTAVTIIVVLLIMLVSPKVGTGWLTGRGPVCDHVLVGRGSYCSECGSRV